MSNELQPSFNNPAVICGDISRELSTFTITCNQAPKRGRYVMLKRKPDGEESYAMNCCSLCSKMENQIVPGFADVTTAVVAA